MDIETPRRGVGGEESEERGRGRGGREKSGTKKGKTETEGEWGISYTTITLWGLHNL